MRFAISFGMIATSTLLFRQFQELTMPIVRYIKVLLQTPGIGSVLICFLGLLSGAVLLSEWGRSTNGISTHSARNMAQSASTPLAPSGPLSEDIDAHEMKSIQAHRHATLLLTASHPAITPPLARPIFQQPIASDQLEFLNEYAGRPANDVVRERELRALVNKVVPYAPFHLGLDIPLPNAIESMFSTSLLPVAIREGRYVIVSGQRGPNARGRDFLWIDMQEGIALGGIFFYPSNGEPTPTLTLFSKQVKEGSLEMSQLPSAFVQDLSRWATTAGIPPLTTRYFINASSEKTVLAHEEDFCRAVHDKPAPDACRQMNAEAADIDQKAAYFLDQTQYASNATMHMIAGYDAP
jgi:hypothetical protein